ncbi:alpha/beta hydrolase [Mangrovicoccus ximenensis]|uniref:alpha/beta hydrolase n=1 Tax=Mangrovicoccus ximenensis TaxID=1911570 RepID=UPI000D386809|nr:alpha/beta hydrolase [Mangrovicoccus ximenensis]
MNRRAFSVSVLGLLLSSAAARAGEAIFLDFDQDGLNEAYDQSAWAPNAPEVIDRYTTVSAEVRRKYPPRTESYGPGAAETLDIFTPADANGLPVMVFVHGGTWRLLSSAEAAHPAPTFVENGCIYIALNFDNIPDIRLPGMAMQCRRAMAWIFANIARFGGDQNRIFVSGHSSGGHLAGVLLTTDWAAQGLPADLIKGGVLLSGMFDLHPVMLSSRRDYLSLTPRETADLSPIRHLDLVACDILVVYGANESPEFQRQSIDFANALAGMGRLSGRIELRANHFEVPEALNSSGTKVAQASLTMMHT